MPRWLRRLYHPVMRDFSLNYTAVHPQIAAEYGIRETALAEFFGAEHSTAAVRRNLYEYFDPGIENRFAETGWKIEQRDPTLDKRIYEFCYGIPIEQYLVGAQTRSLVRRAMDGRLPQSTLRCTTRGLQAADWYMTVRSALPQLSAELTRIEKSPLARRILDTPRLRTLIETFPSSGYHTTAVSEAWHHALTRGIAVGSFLAEHDPDSPREEEDPAREEPGAVPGS